MFIGLYVIWRSNKMCVNLKLLLQITYKPMNIVYKWKLDYLSNNKKCVNLKLLLQITYKPMNIVYLDYLSNNKKCVNLLLLQITVIDYLSSLHTFCCWKGTPPDHM